MPALSRREPGVGTWRAPKTYGRPIAAWQALVRQHCPAKHMELVAMLKREHGMGHGHANAIVAHTLAEDRL